MNTDPELLRLPESEWPNDLPISTSFLESRAKKIEVNQYSTVSPWKLQVENYSSFGKAKDVMSFVNRFINLKIYHALIPSGYLCLEELELASKHLISQAQLKLFHQEILSIRKEKQVSKSSN